MPGQPVRRSPSSCRVPSGSLIGPVKPPASDLGRWARGAFKRRKRAHLWGNLVVRVGVCHHGVQREGLAGLWGSLRGRCASAACWRSGPDGSKWCARSKARMHGSDLVLALRPGWTHPGGAPSRAGRRLRAYAVAASRKGVSVRHMACRITASLRARATLAFRGPVRSAIARAQSRRRDAPSLRVMMALAAS